MVDRNVDEIRRGLFTKMHEVKAEMESLPSGALKDELLQWLG